MKCLSTVLNYRKDTEPFYHAFMYSPVILLSSIYPFTQCLSLLACYNYIIYLELFAQAWHQRYFAPPTISPVCLFGPSTPPPK